MSLINILHEFPYRTEIFTGNPSEDENIDPKKVFTMNKEELEEEEVKALKDLFELTEKKEDQKRVYKETNCEIMEFPKKETISKGKICVSKESEIKYSTIMHKIASNGVVKTLFTSEKKTKRKMFEESRALTLSLKQSLAKFEAFKKRKS